MLKSSHCPNGKLTFRPDGNIADALASTHACTTAANAPVNFSRYVPQGPEISHRPNGNIADVLASTLACTTVADAPVFYSRYTCSRDLKLPIAPMGELLTCLPRLTLAQLQTLRSITVGTCRRDLEKFPTPPWETHDLLVVCRAAVSSSLSALSR
jgi:hypothetical protein